jgi:hypothetical protein
VRSEDGVAAAIRQLERWGLLPEPKSTESKEERTRTLETVSAIR